jgi:hypothetical protein
MNTKMLDNLIIMVSVLHTEFDHAQFDPREVTCTFFDKTPGGVSKICRGINCGECIFSTEIKNELPEIINLINKELDKHEQIS